MKKKYTLFSLIILCSAFATKAQNGLEGIIVEKYYVSNVADTAANDTDGELPIGSVTYRVFADMLPGYKLQAIFGTSAPLHPLKFATTRTFFNNTDRGEVIANSIPFAQLKNETKALDSYISMGASSTGNNYGVLKTEDNGVANLLPISSNPFLKNANPTAGIPLSVQDGIIAGPTAPQAVTLVGIAASPDLDLIYNTNDSATTGNSFVTTNGSIAALAGAEGPDLTINKVLIGQFTTPGIFTFELNIQIGTPTGGTQQFVASNPTGNEILLPSLTYSSISDVSAVNINNPIFSLYPNPSTDVFKVRINQSSQSQNNSIQIFDLLGHLVFEKKLGKTYENQVEAIDISHLASGQYAFQLDLNGNKSAKKILKK